MDENIDVIVIKHNVKKRSTEFITTDAYAKLSRADQLEILNNTFSFLQGVMCEEILHLLRNVRRRKPSAKEKNT